MKIILSKGEYTDLAKVITGLNDPNTIKIFNDVFDPNKGTKSIHSRVIDSSILEVTFDEKTSKDVIRIFGRHIFDIRNLLFSTDRGLSLLSRASTLFDSLKAEFKKMF